MFHRCKKAALARRDFSVISNNSKESSGVSDGARTRDISDHNRVLYQLSYAHHVGQILPATTGSELWGGQPIRDQPERFALGSWLRSKDGGLVVAKFDKRILDIAQCAMVPDLFWCIEIDPRIPTAG